MAEDDEAGREGYRELIAEMPHARPVFVDEVGINLDLVRTSQSERAVDHSVARNTSTRTAWLGDTGAECMICPRAMEGAINEAVSSDLRADE